MAMPFEPVGSAVALSSSSAAIAWGMRRVAVERCELVEIHAFDIAADAAFA